MRKSNRTHVLTAVVVATIVAVVMAMVPAGAGNGDPMILGTKNSARRVTKLIGKNGMEIRASKNIPLRLYSQPGVPPIKVNNTTKVDLLNADLLDGQDASAFLSASEDTFIYVPGSLMRFHMDDGAGATARFNLTSQAIVRKEGSPGDIYVDIPVPLPARQSGDWVKLINMRVYYMVDNAANYIDAIWLHKINETGGHTTVGTSGTNGASTSWSSLLVECTSADCQLSWPTGGFVTVDMQLHFGGIGAANEIQIGGVLMRVSYDG